MALVKVISDNLFSGANLQKVEVGSKIDVADKTAEKWVAAGLAEMIENRTFEVATPGDDDPEQPAPKSKKDK
jgi:hypothetical protein